MIWSSYTRIIASICTIALVGLSFAADPAPAPAAAAPAAKSPAPASAPAPAVAPAPANNSAPAATSAKAVPATPVSVAPRGTSSLDEMIQRKLDSLNNVKVSAPVSVNSDSLAKVKSDSVRKMIQEGKYVQRAKYDKSNFDSWKVDTLFQKSMKESMFGVWRTPIVAHGHAFRDAELRFDANDTLYGTTRTYSDSGRYQMTGEYTFKARYRFDNDTSMVTREVFADRQVIRWDYITFRQLNDTLTYNLNKLEFRDMNDNWLNALQGFDNVPAEVYIRDEKLSAEMKKTNELWAKRKNKK